MKIPDFLLESVNIENSLCGSYERHDDTKESKKEEVTRTVHGSLIWPKKKQQSSIHKSVTRRTQLPKTSKENPFFFFKLSTHFFKSILHKRSTADPSHDKSLRTEQFLVYQMQK